MTCIVGIAHDGHVYMGADSAAVESSSRFLQTLAEPKLFINGEFLIGYTSSFRMGQLLQFKFAPPKQKENQGDFQYMCTDFIDAIRECLASGGFKSVDKYVETGGTFLVGYRGCIYKVQDDFAILRSEDSADACGCGAYYALSAIAAFKTIPYYPIPVPDWTKSILSKALQIAERYSGGVRGPFTILEL